MSYNYTIDDLRNWLRLAADAARAGGEFLIEATSSLPVVTSEQGKDVKLDVDYEAEARILKILRAHSSFDILSEERGEINRTKEGSQRWIVDPLDGSFNYLHRIPLCCVSVGLWANNTPLLGAIYDFNRQESYEGIVGVGAWVNKMPVCVGAAKAPQQAMLCTGFPVGSDFSPEALLTFVEQIRQYKKIRLLGSAALMLAYVAAGRADAYYERNIRLWDVAAGAAIVRAAGGTVVLSDSGESHFVTIYAANSTIPPIGLESGPSSLKE